jgi:hypothetical protein
MVIDGNDDRGIDVGVMTRGGYVIGLMRSHIHDRAGGRTIYSRDCPEYQVTTPAGETIWVLPNHFKSKFGGDTAQAARTAEIYETLRDGGHDHVIVLGDLNDTPDSPPLQALLADTDLSEVSDHPDFEPGEFTGRPGTDERGIGTFGLGNDNNKIDYLLLSPALFDRVTAAGLFRKGAWPGTRPPRWTVYPPAPTRDPRRQRPPRHLGGHHRRHLAMRHYATPDTPPGDMEAGKPARQGHRVRHRPAPHGQPAI